MKKKTIIASLLASTSLTALAVFGSQSYFRDFFVANSAPQSREITFDYNHTQIVTSNGNNYKTEIKQSYGNTSLSNGGLALLVCGVYWPPGEMDYFTISPSSIEISGDYSFSCITKVVVNYSLKGSFTNFDMYFKTSTLTSYASIVSTYTDSSKSGTFTFSNQILNTPCIGFSLSHSRTSGGNGDVSVTISSVKITYTC